MKNLLIGLFSIICINGCATTPHEPIKQNNNFAVTCSGNDSCHQKSEQLCGKEGYIVKSTSPKIDSNDYKSILLSCNLVTMYY